MPYQYSSQNNRKYNTMPTPKYVQIKEYLKNEALKPEAVNNMPSVRTLIAGSMSPWRPSIRRCWNWNMNR